MTQHTPDPRDGMDVGFLGQTLFDRIAERATGDAISNLDGTMTVSLKWLESFMHEAQIVASPVWAAKASVAECTRLRSVNAQMLKALREARAAFLNYEASHRAKSVAQNLAGQVHESGQSTKKAAANFALAERLSAAIAAAEAKE